MKVKFLLCAMIFIIPKISISQEIKPLTFDSTITVDSVKKDMLYQRARLWFTNYFNNSKAVIEIDDKEGGLISGKGILMSYCTYRLMGQHTDELNLRFTITIYLKDNKYKYLINNITTDAVKKSDGIEMMGALTTSKSCPHDYPMIGKKKEDEMWMSAIESSTHSIQVMLLSLNDAMNKKNDW